VEHAGQTVLFDPDGVCEEFAAIVRLDDPTREYERGEGTAHTGQILFTTTADPGLVRGSKLVIDEKIYMVSRVARPEDGNNIAYIHGNDQAYTAPGVGVNRER